MKAAGRSGGDTGADSEILLAVKELGFSYGEQMVLRSVSFRLERGQKIALLGPSGCGKTTLLHCVAGFVKAQSGLVELEPGLGISYMQQKDLLLPWSNVLDNVSLPLLAKGVPAPQAEARSYALLEHFGLAAHAAAYPQELSGGMRQRVALARAAIVGNGLLLLDEPFTHLDAFTRNKLYRWFLSNLVPVFSGVLLVTHDIEEALELADTLLILGPGPAEVLGKIDVKARGNDGARKEAKALLFGPFPE